MIEKRFTYDNGNLFDNKMNTFYQIEDSDENIELFCDNLNSLVEENEQLKQRISELELLNDGLNYALKNIRKIDVKIDVGDDE